MGARGPLVLTKIRFDRGLVSVPTPIAGEDTICACSWGPRGAVVALDRNVLAMRWKVPSEDFGPVILVHPATVVLGSGKAQLRGLSAENGRTYWTVAIPAWPEPGSRVWGDANQLHVIHGGKESVFDITTGTLQEERPHQDPIPHGTTAYGSLRFFWTRFYGPNADQETDSQGVGDVERGEILWERRLYLEMGRRTGEAWPVVEKQAEALYVEGVRAGIARPAFGDPSIFVVRYGHHVFGCSLKGGEILWHVGPMDVHLARPVIADGRVYVLMSRANSPYNAESRFLCLDLGTGQTVYDVPLEQIEPVEPLPAILTKEGIVWAMRHVGRMLLLQRSNGELLWTDRQRAEVGVPLLDRERLIFPAYDGSLLVYDGLSRLGA